MVITKRTLNIFIVFTLILSISPSAGAKSWREIFMFWKTDKAAEISSAETVEEGSKKISNSFSDEDRETIKEYFKRKIEEQLSDGNDIEESDDDKHLEKEDDDNNDNHDHGKKHGKSRKKHKTKSASSGTLPPGLQKKLDNDGALPPGLQKQLEKNGVLPPGLAKRALPDDLVKQISSVDNDNEVVIVDDDVILIEKAKGKILDIIKDVLKEKVENL